MCGGNRLRVAAEGDRIARLHVLDMHPRRASMPAHGQSTRAS